MCTPSATPPKWMIDKYPDILQNDIHGNPKLVPLKLIREIPMRAITHPMKNAGRSFPSSFKKMRAVIAVNTGAIETITPTFDACE